MHNREQQLRIAVLTCYKNLSPPAVSSRPALTHMLFFEGIIIPSNHKTLILQNIINFKKFYMRSRNRESLPSLSRRKVNLNVETICMINISA